MESITEISEVLRRASIVSAQKAEENEKPMEEKLRELNKGPPPKDRFYFIYILFLLIGLLQFLPGSFFVTANDYWMYKFRNTSDATWDSKHRNSLQKFFASWSSMVSSIPSAICMLISTFYGHKVSTRSRLLLTLFVVASCFTMFTIFVKVNTDAWQTGFFVLTMAVLILINGTMIMFQAASLVFLSKLPPKYMFPFLFGQGVAGIFNATLQVISLSIGTSSETAAIIYFVAGTSLIWLTWLLIFFSRHSGFYQYYLSSAVNDTKRPVYKWSDIQSAARKIWPCMSVMATNMLTLVPLHPALTSLVVSENYGQGIAWSDTYFVPVVTFLFSEICSLIGRVAARITIKPSTTTFWATASFVRMLVFIPVMCLCNALPRNHLPVVFDKDWEYILIVAAFFVTNGFSFNLIFLSVPTLAPGNEEVSFLTMMTFVTIFGVFCSPLSLLSVRMI